MRVVSGRAIISSSGLVVAVGRARASGRRERKIAFEGLILLFEFGL